MTAASQKMKKVDLREFWKYATRPSIVTWAVAEYEGRRSVCPLSWWMRTSLEPPMVAISVAPARFTHGLIAGSGEFVLAWPGDDLAEATWYCGTHSARDPKVDKFAAARLTAAPAECVGAPLIAECAAQLECRVTAQCESGDHTIFVGEVLRAWMAETPRKPLCLVEPSRGVEVLLRRGGYTFGALR